MSLCVFLLYFIVTSNAEDVSYRETGCYGDASGDSDNRLVASCSTGRIYINDILVGTKPASVGCPSVDHQSFPALAETCCTYNTSTDCVRPYTGFSLMAYLSDCTGAVKCEKQVIWDVMVCDTAVHVYPTFSSYMVLDYVCRTTGVFGSPCDGVTDCRYARPECQDQVCGCEDDYSYVGGECVLDGSTGGECLLQASVPCTDPNAECSYSGICQCRVGFRLIDDRCTEGDDGLQRVTSCYGDRISLSCETGGIYIVDISVAAKQLQTNCGLVPTDHAECCTVNVTTDCINKYEGLSIPSFHACYGKSSCENQAVWAPITCEPPGLFPSLSNYMIIDYYCLPFGHNFGPCSGTADCMDPAADCDKASCQCTQDHVAADIFDRCWEDGHVNGDCMFGSDTPCKGQNTKCDYGSNKCVCIDTYVIDDVIMECVCPSGYREVNSRCTNDGMPGGFCNSSVPCIVEGSVCNSVTSTCECDASQNLTLHDGECIPAGNLHGYCDTHTVCVDPNTECRDNTCVCSAGFSDIQGECLQDGMPGGSCLANKQCTLNTTRCSYLTGLCECVGNFTAVGGICVEDGYPMGRCSNTGVTPCRDANTECRNGTCVCVENHTYINGRCILDGTEDGFCDNNGGCSDFKIHCNSASGLCVCRDEYINTDGDCSCPGGFRDGNGGCVPESPDGTLGGFCNATTECFEAHTKCDVISGVCICDDVNNYTEYNGTCVPAGSLHGLCSELIACVDPLTLCTNQTCLCLPQHSEINGKCLKDGSHGGYCTVAVECLLDNAVCVYGICQCASGYTFIDNICILDGSNGGVCLTNATSTCNDVNAECNSDRCRCKTGFFNIHGICKEDQQPGGRCSPPTLSCLSNLTECSEEGICRCITSYTLVNGDCENDGSISGVCKSTDVATIGDCDDVNAMCVDDDTGQCAGTNCKPGICRCKAGYKLGSLGQCAVECATDSDCLDANANCHPTLFVCECSLQYTLVKDACVGPGEVGGECRSTLGSECDDVHAVCLDGKCTCNDVRHYVIKDGKCVKNDTYTNGLCGQNKPCRDSNAHCQSGTCVCKANYVSVNGRCVNDGNNAQSCDSDDSCPNHAQCVEGQCACAQNYVMVHGVCVKSNSSVISSCEGDSPYNTLQPECPSGKTAVITDAYTMVAMRAACPPKMDVYSSTLFEQCCTPNSTDCRLDAPGCMQGSFSTYDVVEYTCVDDGSNGGVCLTNASPTCNDVNAECNSDRCRCKTGFFDIHGICKEDQQPGGRCSPPTLSCLSNLTECSEEGICRCITSYTLVNGDCENDGSISGVCKSTDVATIRDCDDVNAMCVDDDTGQCAGTNCKPGICRCKAGYKLGSLGQCAEECATDSDCSDANANCHPTLFVCECSLQYTLVKDVCVGPGEVGGECRSTLGSECDDVHAVCLDGKCTCNDVRHYVIKDGKCVKNDTYTNGLCGQNKPCRDSNAHCQSGTCVCKANYVSVNGRCVNDANNAQSCGSDDSCANHAQCVEGQCSCKQNYAMVHGVCVKSNSSVISSCEGDSPYNTLQPECPSGKTAVITDVYTMVAMRAACPPKMDVYNSTLFEQCCTPYSTDCRLDAPGCMQGSFSTYDVVEYTCVDDSAVIGHEDDDSVSGNPVYVVSPGGHTESGSGGGTSASLCHVRADCKTTLYVYVVYMEQGGGTCSPILILNGEQTDCNKDPVFTTAYGYLKVESVASNGSFSLKFEGDENVSIQVACGSKSSSITLSEPDSCVTPPPTVMWIVITICLLLLVGLLVIAWFCLKDKICKPVLAKPDLIADTSPANTKFAATPKTMAVTPANEKFRRENTDLPSRSTLPPITSKPPVQQRWHGALDEVQKRGKNKKGKSTRQKMEELIQSLRTPRGSDAVGNTRFSRALEMDKVTAIPPHNLNEDLSDMDKKKKKKKSRNRKIKNSIAAISRFHSGDDFSGQQGVFRPTENFHTYQPQVVPLGPGGLPSFRKSSVGADGVPLADGASMNGFITMHPPPGPPGRLPPVQAPQVTGPAPKDFVEAEDLPKSLRLPSRQGMFSQSGTSNPGAWAQSIAPSTGSYHSEVHPPPNMGFSMNSELSSSGTFGPLFRRTSVGVSGQPAGQSIYSRHSSGDQFAPHDPQVTPRPRTVRRPSQQLDISSLGDRNTYE
ncbi:neurogenic locus notch homolog protein 2-like isoform X3 [Mya arenaria]|uniref:neurogenic locus notch homolog protein 2-like isoform X3 n=1 Tax=Mya arenaria TaxID=6604 RepID=UPI0022E437A3|nr:neurogenic locus notch homolog protein 2-like isoform X3 [Mya arenaria]